MALVKITLVQRALYKDRPEDFSNSWHLDVSAAPSTGQGWTDLMTAVWNVQSRFQSGGQNVRLVHGYGYDGSNTHADGSIDFTGGIATAGLIVAANGFAGGNPCPMEVCVVLRGHCGSSPTTHKPRYSMKYLHAVVQDPTTVGKRPPTTTGQDVALATMLDGTLPLGAKWCAPNGTLVTDAHSLPYLGFHQLKRRGKRPTRGA